MHFIWVRSPSFPQITRSSRRSGESTGVDAHALPPKVSKVGRICRIQIVMVRCWNVITWILWEFGLDVGSEFICSPPQSTDSSRVCLLLNFNSEFSSPLLARLRLADYCSQGLTSHAVSVRCRTCPHLGNHGA